MVTATGPSGRHTEYGYDSAGDLVSVADPLGCVTRFEYDVAHAHHLAAIIGPDGVRRAALGYDEHGRLSTACDPTGACSACAMASASG